MMTGVISGKKIVLQALHQLHVCLLLVKQWVRIGQYKHRSRTMGKAMDDWAAD